jgi:hypothetical protein
MIPLCVPWTLVVTDAYFSILTFAQFPLSLLIMATSPLCIKRNCQVITLFCSFLFCLFSTSSLPLIALPKPNFTSVQIIPSVPTSTITTNSVHCILQPVIFKHAITGSSVYKIIVIFYSAVTSDASFLYQCLLQYQLNNIKSLSIQPQNFLTPNICRSHQDTCTNCCTLFNIVFMQLIFHLTQFFIF